MNVLHDLKLPSDYKLLPGSNQLWPNVAYGEPLPDAGDCCLVPHWLDDTYTGKSCSPPSSSTGGEEGVRRLSVEARTVE
jgi:hypothetical protein